MSDNNDAGLWAEQGKYLDFYLSILLHGMCVTITSPNLFLDSQNRKGYTFHCVSIDSIIHISMFHWDTHLSKQNLDKDTKTQILCPTKSAYVLCKLLHCCMQYHITLDCIIMGLMVVYGTRLKLNEDNLMLGTNIYRYRWLEGSGCMTS